jgi:glutathione S-transferase
METNSGPAPVLITFPPSLDSELARFLVQHYGIRHQEKPHALIFSSFVTLRHGWTVIFPLLYGKSLKLVGPRAISEYFDTQCPADLKLWPQEAGLKSQVEKDWTQFNQLLAFATARFAYYHLLPRRALMVQPLSQGTSAFEQKSIRFGYPVFAGLLRTLLGLTAKQAAESLAQVTKICEEVGVRLGDGRKYLCGDKLTLSDLAFAVAAAPIVLPAKYGGPIPTFDQMPSAVQNAVTQMRALPAGKFALRIYEEQRQD